MSADVVAMRDQSLLETFTRTCGHIFNTRYPVDDRDGQVKTVKPVQHTHIEGCGRGAFFLVSVDVEVLMIRPAIRQPVNQPRVAVICEDHGSVRGEQGVKVAIR